MQNNVAKREADPFVPQINYHYFLKCSPDWQLPEHSVGNTEITYVVEGKACYTIDGKPHTVKPGDMLYLSGNSTEQAVTNPKNPMRCFSINFGPLAPVSSSGPNPSFPIQSRIGLRKDLINLFTELTVCWSEQRDGYKMKSRALLMLILHRLQEIVSRNVSTEEEGSTD